jgi:hypothetical protein
MTTLMNPLFVKTSARRNAYSVLGYLLLIYFAIYATSPLSYSFAVSKISERVYPAKGKTDLGKNFSIFLLEVICARIDAKKDIDQANSGVKVLIRKARAILPETADSTFAPSGILTLFTFLSSLSDNSSSRLSAYSNGQHFACDVDTRHSGLSPPLA